MTGAAEVRDALRRVVDPCSAATGANLDIVEMGLVIDVSVNGSAVEVDMRLTTPVCHMVAFFVREIEEHVGSLQGVDSVTVEIDHDATWTEDALSAEAAATRRRVLEGHETRYDADRATE